MASKSETGDEVEQSSWTKEDLKDYAILGSVKKLGTPMVWAGWEQIETVGDCYEAECPYCEGEVHHHQTSLHPEVAFGGISPAYCNEYQEQYYLTFVPSQEVILPGSVIHEARRNLTNYPGENLQNPLIPRGIDPRVIDEILSDWTEGVGTKYD